MPTLTQAMADAITAESFAPRPVGEPGVPVSRDGLTFLPGRGFFVGSEADARSRAVQVRIGEEYGEPLPVPLIEMSAEERAAHEAASAPEPRASLDAADPSLTMALTPAVDPLAVTDVHEAPESKKARKKREAAESR